MRFVVVDGRIDKKCEESLRERGFGLIKMPPFSALQEPVSSHPDMLFFLGEGRLVCHSDYFAVAGSEIEKTAEILGSSIAITDEVIGAEYPRDVLFNAAAVGDRLICRRDALSEKVAELYSEDGIINVRQGYAKCSVCVVSENAIVTADPSIAEVANKNGIDVLEVSRDGVRLDGYGCGFIGGASGTDGERIYFCGRLELHPDGERIKEFCKAHGKETVSLSDEPLYDYGTLIFL